MADGRARSRSPRAAPERSLRILMCRHGTTHWNLAKKWQGEKDTELAPVGVEQASKTSELIAESLNLKEGGCIYTSDLKRAHATAEIYGKKLGWPVIVEPKLREPSLGKFEGMHRDEIYGQHAELFKKLGELPQEERLHKSYFDGLETPFETCRRVQEVLARIQSESKVSSVLFVSHSKVLEAVLACVFGKYYEGIHTSPCAFFEWDAQPGSHRLGKLHSIEFFEHVVPQ
eukprot:TRINITY_DN111003_c0_g1_i1.p1 TRINITY_DN111003_c0_g1~~TRINITY_DN111003_c0_g1_i1.p1  ORF type:complete len:230 (-),score=42.21 TRINITY_DN111003_c0_g1_i1:231-920(-)